MDNDHRKSAKDLNVDLDRQKSTEPDKALNRDIHRNLQSERFPESKMTKDQRKDAESVNERESSDVVDDLAQDVDGTVGSRATSSSPDDIAGVADLDKGLGRSRKS